MTRSAIINYLMCGVVTFALHWQTLDGFRAEAQPPGYKAAFFFATVVAWPATIAATVILRDFDGAIRARGDA